MTAEMLIGVQGLFIAGKVTRVRHVTPAEGSSSEPSTYMGVDVGGFEALDVRCSDELFPPESLVKFKGMAVILSVTPTSYERRISYNLRSVLGSSLPAGAAPTPAGAGSRSAA